MVVGVLAARGGAQARKVRAVQLGALLLLLPAVVAVLVLVFRMPWGSLLQQQMSWKGTGCSCCPAARWSSCCQGSFCQQMHKQQQQQQQKPEVGRRGSP
jgi:hypothetical protein